jgi:hypothetical protein
MSGIPLLEYLVVLAIDVVEHRRSYCITVPVLYGHFSNFRGGCFRLPRLVPPFSPLPLPLVFRRATEPRFLSNTYVRIAGPTVEFYEGTHTLTQ